jgi:formate--tetrahydrofolate ligase
MLTDVEIAQQSESRRILDIAVALGLSEDDILPYGRDKAKVRLEVLDRSASATDGKLILVTAITPTSAGEGKTTTTIGLGDALRRLGHSASIAIREPSLGPCFGVKGGAAGGGRAQVVPMVDINLHFTGDFHAVTTANNLLSALLNNHLHQGNALNIDPRSITWRRVIDMNDRALRDVVVGLGGNANGFTLQSGFDITAASEIMALLCLARDRQDLKDRLARVMIGVTDHGDPVTAKDLQADGAMAVALKDAMLPNLVQTLEGTPAFVHGGPYGNIAHGCNSLIATRMALKLSDYVVTEAGFGSDLGAEKFCNIKCRVGGLIPRAAVVVATVRALKMHGGQPHGLLETENVAAVRHGMENLEKHCENMRILGLEPIVAINRFPSDTEAEIKAVTRGCDRECVKHAVSDVWAQGGDGGMDLASLVVEACEREATFHPAYPLNIHLRDKVEIVARSFYGADGVDFSPAAAKQIREIESLGFRDLPVCVAKTQSSLSDDARLLGRPRDFRITVREARVSAGAGMVVVYAGSIMTMPGLPKTPAATKMGMDSTGEVYGLF